MGKAVGILSMQRVINYGSFLQAYALKQMLLNNGASSVEFIDIVKGRQLKGYEHSGLIYKLRRLNALLKLIVQGRIFEKKRTRQFMNEVTIKIRSSWYKLGIELKPNQSQQHLDLAVIGSDEVFHCCQSTDWGYTTQLYGNIPQAKGVCSYAASFGATKIEQLRHLCIDGDIANQLRNLNKISVRDSNSENIIKELLGITPLRHIDPVLAYGFVDEIKNSPSVGIDNYILIYSYPDRINDKNEIKAIVDFAKAQGKKLVSVMSRYDWCDMAIIPTPLEMLSWFKNADYVITETFHGSIFSIITHKQFVTIGRESSIPKLTSMLEPYGLKERLLKTVNNLPNIITTPIDYKHIDKILKELRGQSNEYLKAILTN